MIKFHLHFPMKIRVKNRTSSQHIHGVHTSHYQVVGVSSHVSMCTSTRLTTWQYLCWTTCHSLHYYPDNHRSTQKRSIWTAWVHWGDNIFLPAPNPPWYLKRWPSDTEVTDGTFPHPYVCISGPSHLISYLQWVELAASCIMTRRLTQPPVTLNYNDCSITYWSTIIIV